MVDTGYPAHWEADVLLADGRAAHLRPILPADGTGLVRFYERVSPESKYMRFFAPYPTLSDRDVERFTHVDHADRVGFVVTLAGDIIGIGRYDRIDAEQAEVAFLIEDAHQGRGLGQLLLEHLAQAGRERELTRFVAEVLPENVRMIQIFREAGYKVEGGFEDGVMRLVFPIDPTDTSVGVMQSREHRAEARSIQGFFSARSIAVVGASRRQETIGQTIVRNLVLGGYTGRVFAVNPAAQAVSGLPAYARVQDVPEPVELAIVAVPADAVEDVVLDCAAKGVRGLIVISSGFAETGEEGRKRQRRLVGLARSYGLRLVGPNCLGVINTNPSESLNASLSPLMPPRGRVGFFSQSGALGVAILENVDRRGLGLSSFVSAGNRADVSGNDLLQYWEEDDDTEVILLYLESIGNPRKFSRIARRVALRKPIVAVKSGRTTQGVPVGHAVRSTTAPQAAVDAMFRQAGVIRVDTLDEMFDVAQLVAHQPLPRGPRVAIVGNSDALGLLATDAAAAAGLVVKDLVALGPEATADDFERALDNAVDDAEVDAVVAVFIPPLNTTGEQVANVLAAVGEQSDKPLLSTFLASEGVPELLRVPDVQGSAGRGSVPSYPAPESAVRALSRVVAYSTWLQRSTGEIAAFEDIDVRRAHRLVGQWLTTDPDGVDLDMERIGELLDIYGIELWPAIRVGSLDEALEAGSKLGWGVVLKATALHLQQRPDLSHVWRNIDDETEMRDAWQTLNDIIDDAWTADFVVQRMAPPGIPVSMRSMEDPLFGPIVSFGVAGAPSDLLDDRSYRIPPLTDADAGDMVREIRAAPLLFGYRGSEQIDVACVEDLLQRLARLKNDLPEVAVIDFGLVLAGAGGCSVLSATCRVAPVRDSRSDWFARRLSVPPGDTLPG
ncbi:MAG TPA: bifunctional GNAT family N-acetyltransferase/acetate--CoA ligase family protein [Nocardioidaceae bacterium]|nr:bifunctional GNAT family N-acetyltransferase/acetate--CoA ligase family protein [Nocardioidaceae bacterium]